MSFLDYRNCWACKIGRCHECDMNSADLEDEHAWEAGRCLMAALGVRDPGPLACTCKCADEDHPWRRGDSPYDMLSMSPECDIIIKSNLL